MNIVGSVPAKVNGKYAITISDLSSDESIPTKVHRGAFGNFGTSQAPEGDITISFKVAVPETGFEFNWKAEFAKDGASITLDPPVSAGFTGVKLSKKSLAIDNAQGNTVQTINCTAEHEVDL